MIKKNNEFVDKVKATSLLTPTALVKLRHRRI